jgi:hypothetical protein
MKVSELIGILNTWEQEDELEIIVDPMREGIILFTSEANDCRKRSILL